MLIDYRTDSGRRESGEAVPATVAPAGSVRRRLAVGVGWSVAGGVLWQGCALLSSIVAARMIGKLAYGHLATVQTTAISLSNLASLGLGVTATKYVSQFRDSDPARAGRILGLSSMVALLAATAFALSLLWSAPSVSLASFRTAALTPELRVAAGYVFFTIWNGYQAGALAGLESFRRLAQLSAWYGVTSLIVTILLSHWLGERGAVLAFSAGALLLWSFHQFALRRELRRFKIKVSWRGAWQERSVLVRFAVPATFSGVIGSVAIWWCYCWLVQSRGFAEMAVYTAANNLRAAVLFAPNLVTRVTLPLLNNLQANRLGNAYRRMFWLSLWANGGIAVAVAFVLALAGPRMLKWFGRDFAAGPTLLWLLMGSAVLEVVACNLYQATFARQSLFWQIAVISLWAAVLVGATRLLVRPLAASGLAAAYGISWAISALFYLKLYRPPQSLADDEAADAK
ncbi:MAG TPA: oligosaccharide flippase family protein [Bryobacteraceae bacterium]|nr:oligosaccharide flippase family protein [Bryobacteraceae bacterium]